MIVKKFRHENTRPDGTFTDKSGAVEVQGSITMSAENGGCSLEHCTCSEGHWICISAPRTPDGVVEGMTVYFDNQAEMQYFFDNRGLRTSNLFN